MLVEALREVLSEGRGAPSGDSRLEIRGFGYDVIVALQERDGRGALQQLLGDRFDAFWALRPSQETVAEIFEHLGELYPKGDDDEPSHAKEIPLAD